MGRVVDPEPGVPGPSDVRTVERGPSSGAELSVRLMDALADDPPIVVCDLDNLARPADVAEAFAPVQAYLLAWPGTMVVTCVTREPLRARLLAGPVAGTVVVAASAESGVEEARRRLPEARRITTHLSSQMTTARDARRFATRTLLDWGLSRMVAPTALVVSELVTHSVVDSDGGFDLTLATVGPRVRVAVREKVRARGGDTDRLEMRGLMLVEASSLCWGVFPGYGGARTIWAVVDEVQSRPRHGHRSGAAS